MFRVRFFCSSSVFILFCPVFFCLCVFILILMAFVVSVCVYHFKLFHYLIYFISQAVRSFSFSSFSSRILILLCVCEYECIFLPSSIRHESVFHTHRVIFIFILFDRRLFSSSSSISSVCVFFLFVLLLFVRG